MKRLALFLVVALPTFAAREFLSASSEFGLSSTAVATTYPSTVAAWVFVYATNASQVPIAICSSGQTRWIVADNTDGRFLLQATDSAGTSSYIFGTNRWNTNAWMHVAGVVESATSRKLYVNGTQDSTNDIVSITMTGFDRTVVGGRYNGSAYAVFWNGRIADATSWSVALTAAEISALAAGGNIAAAPNPREIRPDKQQTIPLLGVSDPEYSTSGTHLSLSNSPAAVAHPPLRR